VDEKPDRCFVYGKDGYRFVDHKWKSLEVPEDQPHHHGWLWIRCSGCGLIRRADDS